VPKTTYLRNAQLNQALRGTAWTPPALVYCALFNVAPTAAGGGTEVSVGGYVRQSVTFGAPSNGRVYNSTDVVFPVATADQGDVVAYGIMDALTAGNLLYWANLNVAYPVQTDNQWKFPVGTLLVIED